MKKIKLLTMALLPITTLGATIGMASCSASKNNENEIISDKEILKENINSIITNYDKNINSKDSFVNILKSEVEKEKVKKMLKEIVTDLDLLRAKGTISEYKTVVSDKEIYDAGKIRVKVEVVVKLQAYGYEVSYWTPNIGYVEKKIRMNRTATPLYETVYETIYEYTGDYDFPTDWVRFV